MFEVVQFDMRTTFMKSYIQFDIFVFSLNQGPNQPELLPLVCYSMSIVNMRTKSLNLFVV